MTEFRNYQLAKQEQREQTRNKLLSKVRTTSLPSLWITGLPFPPTAALTTRLKGKGHAEHPCLP
jgi:hypothetical protein